MEITIDTSFLVKPIVISDKEISEMSNGKLRDYFTILAHHRIYGRRYRASYESTLNRVMDEIEKRKIQ